MLIPVNITLPRRIGMIGIKKSDIKDTWGYITGFINKYILTEEEYQKFK